MSIHEKDKLAFRVMHEMFESLDCAKSLKMSLLLKYQEFDQLVTESFEPTHYNDFITASRSLQAVSYASKYPYFRTSFSKRDEAIKKFKACEESCSIVNDRLSVSAEIPPSISVLLFEAQNKIQKILGHFDPDEFFSLANWGPGVSTLLKGKDATASNKYRSENKLSPGLKRLLFSSTDLFRKAYPNWVAIEPVSERSNKVSFVPKSAKTDRPIAIEPGLNIWFQKAIGSMIRSRLKRDGIDLNCQKHNQRLARLGSLTNELATIDFSSASDTISSNLVLQLLPKPWFDIMYLCRSTHGLLEGTEFEYEKFSSMGNGFTFELESLIFYAIASSLCDSSDIVSIYGDDLIMPSRHVENAVSVFSFLGFKINSTKSYSSSYYRESCGKHYWNGSNCTPIFLKERLNNEISIYKAANNIRRYSNNRTVYGCDAAYLKPWSTLRNSLSIYTNRILFVADSYGDGGLVVNFDEACPKRLRNGQEGYQTVVFMFKPDVRYHYDHAYLLARLRTIGGDTSYRQGEDIPGRGTYVKRKLHVSFWADLGPWV
jgi:hypothetical protein